MLARSGLQRCQCLEKTSLKRWESCILEYFIEPESELSEKVTAVPSTEGSTVEGQIVKVSEFPLLTSCLYVGVISLCLWGISPSDFASFAHHFASFPHQICFISPTNCFISPTNCFISPTDCFISPTKFSLPHHYFASLCQKLEHNFLIFFPCFSSLELNFEQFFFRELLINLPCHRLSKWYNPQALVLVQTS